MRDVMEQVEAGRNAVAYSRSTIGGAVSLSMPSDLRRNVLLEWLDEFQAQYPGVSLQIRIGDHVIDMFRAPIALAIRYGVPEDSTLVALPLAPDNLRVLCASPAYFASHGRPEKPSGLLKHNCPRFVLSDALHDRWTFFSGNEPSVVNIQGNRKQPLPSPELDTSETPSRVKPYRVDICVSRNYPAVLGHLNLGTG